VTAPASARIAFVVNGSERVVAADPATPLLDVLRDALGLKGTRFGCGENQCGACYVLVEGGGVASCDTPLWAVEGKSVVTVEGLGTPARPHALQVAFLAEQAAQCGYCTAGMLISAAALLARRPQPSEAEVRAALDRNLCRCGSHNRIVRAVLRAAAGAAP
jgi:nicotinate dehydrogenase subunit A